VKQHQPRLRQEIILLVVIKLIAIFALWWYFVRDAQVSIDAPAAADHLGITLRSPTLPGEHHDQ
jgi:hypothetical protein